MDLPTDDVEELSKSMSSEGFVRAGLVPRTAQWLVACWAARDLCLRDGLPHPERGGAPVPPDDRLQVPPVRQRHHLPAEVRLRSTKASLVPGRPLPPPAITGAPLISERDDQPLVMRCG